MTAVSLATQGVSNTLLLPLLLSDGHCLADNINGAILMLITQCPLILAHSYMLVLTTIWDTTIFHLNFISKVLGKSSKQTFLSFHTAF